MAIVAGDSPLDRTIYTYADVIVSGGFHLGRPPMDRRLPTLRRRLPARPPLRRRWPAVRDLGRDGRRSPSGRVPQPTRYCCSGFDPAVLCLREEFGPLRARPSTATPGCVRTSAHSACAGRSRPGPSAVPCRGAQRPSQARPAGSPLRGVRRLRPRHGRRASARNHHTPRRTHRPCSGRCNRPVFESSGNVSLWMRHWGPASWTRRAICTRLFRLSLVSSRDTWALTVASLRNRVAAISALERPRPTSTAT